MKEKTFRAVFWLMNWKQTTERWGLFGSHMTCCRTPRRLAPPRETLKSSGRSEFREVMEKDQEFSGDIVLWQNMRRIIIQSYDIQSCDFLGDMQALIYFGYYIGPIQNSQWETCCFSSLPGWFLLRQESGHCHQQQRIFGWTWSSARSSTPYARGINLDHGYKSLLDERKWHTSVIYARNRLETKGGCKHEAKLVVNRRVWIHVSWWSPCEARRSKLGERSRCPWHPETILALPRMLQAKIEHPRNASALFSFISFQTPVSMGVPSLKTYSNA